MSKYLKRNIIPLCLECIYIFSLLVFPKYILYTNFIFYLGIALYFIIIKDFSIKRLIENLCSGKRFWRNVLFTAIALTLSFVITNIIIMLLPNVNGGMRLLKVRNGFELLIFALSTIILPPLAEELFYRQSLIQFELKKQIPILIIISSLLFALEHSLTPLGILIAILWSIPLTASYIKTKNVYVVIVAHFISNFIVNGLDAISLFNMIY